ncbi:MAG: AMP-binding protein, partial [Acidobacteriota bacterium]
MTAVSAHPLLAHPTPESIVAWRHGEAISVARFLGDVARVAAVLPAGRHVLNTCSDRYFFAVGLAATLVSGRVSLLPSTLTQEVAGHLRDFAPDVFCLTDGDRDLYGLPRVLYPDALPPMGSPPREIPLLADDRPVAWLFTSGSTGKPVPHQKTWGALVKNVRAEGALLGLLDGRRHAIVGTVPAQHMYGFESTVLVAWQCGAAFSAGRPLYPADICGAIAAVLRPRALVTTPFHLRTLLDAGVDIPDLDLLVSATAPLSPGLARAAEARCRAPLLEIYGSTETGQIACRRPVETAEWRLFPGVELTERDGRAWASGGHVEGSVALDDVLELRGAGRFLLHGRSADMINIAGKRSSLAYLN